MKISLHTLHRTAAITAFSLILAFFTSSLTVELWGDHQAIARVKQGIVYGIGLLIPVMALTGITGAKLAPNARSGTIGSKKKRMPFIALNGLLVLMPAAVYLHYLASRGQFDTTFYLVQILELLAGFANLVLMSLNIRDGRRLIRNRAS